MKKTKVINSNLSRVISQMGHFDKIAIGDAGTPVPEQTEKIDLAVTCDIPKFLDVLDNVLEELEVQKIYLAEEIKSENPDMLQQIQRHLPQTAIEFISHDKLKKELNDCKAFVRTGEMTPFANVMLESKVVF
ncbi:D-ribose pyranase [Tetragenococcus halophilus subsp. halophilus]|uniref:D-ribose pyranase n=1 Tax=Tetragenococcus halophilus (strain DSM 20338 / JCM 20259 / NCIMB 9735 / NBRC 12172) TaxID=945021 RepID=A0AAN1VQA6_TETHN|nr:D-ribose pyranase [Tetragenococcus halophilus]MCO8291407.1 D-ribose pyranase [Tetragenococcus halophilus]BAK93798.1 putative ribose transport protein RbsD [Tetragenococcus halophilus NBRC 12172]GBD61804.1 D-ribose pyranase [Tetragenococcus halophilus subsp. halophilus]GBD69771.1 D-ribose pyranase [Tetragenococcus halophilus subsp. halophilus]GBD73562.1 D-ribose pyranase [Tetragenococcus halophilus subsp. halophilus]